MINTQELRIGSYILIDNIMQRVCSIKNDDKDTHVPYIGFEKNNNLEYEAATSDRLAAVPISNELLKEFGFTFNDYHKTWQHEKPKRTVTLELNTEYSALDFSHRTILKHVQYLHLLQNLFFSIQQKELLLKR